MPDPNSKYCINDLVDLVDKQFILMTGAHDKEGRPILTFPDNSNFDHLSAEEYVKLMEYFCTIPFPENLDQGFLVIIDRRKSSWNSVKTVAVKLLTFPDHIGLVLVLRPHGILQRLFPDRSMDDVFSDSKFPVQFIDSCEALHKFADADQLTTALDGTLKFDLNQWISHRASVENFIESASQTGLRARQQVVDISRMDLPLAGDSLTAMTNAQKVARDEVITCLTVCEEDGNRLRSVIRASGLGHDREDTSSHMLPADHLFHVIAIERVLVRVGEIKQQCGRFWDEHQKRVTWAGRVAHFVGRVQVLEPLLRSYASEIDKAIALISCSQPQVSPPSTGQLQRTMASLADTQQLVDRILPEVDELIREGIQFSEEVTAAADGVANQEWEENAGQLTDTAFPSGHSLKFDAQIMSEAMVGHKVETLQNLANTCRSRMCVVMEHLGRVRQLQEYLDQARHWIESGRQLLARYPVTLEAMSMTQCFDALAELDAFLLRKTDDSLSCLAHPKQFRRTFADLINSTISEEVHDVLRQMEDVEVMCANSRGQIETARARHEREAAEQVERDRQQEQQKQAQLAAVANGSRPVQLFDRGQIQTVTCEDIQLSDSTPYLCNDPYRAPSPDNHSVGSTSSGSDLSTTAIILTVPMPLLSSVEDEPALVESNNSPPRQPRNLVMQELLESERSYVQLLDTVHKVFTEVISDNQIKVPDQLQQDQKYLLGNWENLLTFHKTRMFPSLESCVENVQEVGRCIVENRESLVDLYGVYCLHQSSVPTRMTRLGGENQALIRQLRARMEQSGYGQLPFASFLLSPVQRIVKYQLLLKELIKTCTSAGTCEEEGRASLEMGLQVMLNIVNAVNDSMDQANIRGFKGNLSRLGRLINHGDFQLLIEGTANRFQRQRMKQRHIFLYEHALLVCKRYKLGTPATSPDTVNGKPACSIGADVVGGELWGGGGGKRPVFDVRLEIQMNKVGLTEKVGEEKRRFVLWQDNRSLSYVLQAGDQEVKKLWVSQISDLLTRQLQKLKVEAEAKRKTIPVPVALTSIAASKNSLIN